MTAAVWLLPGVLLPGLLGLGLFVRRWRAGIARVLPVASWPLLAATVLAFGSPPVDLPWLILGVRMGVDMLALVLITAGAVIWTVTGAFIVRHVHAPWFLGAVLATQTGSLGALVTFDPIGFYFFFSIMTVASYGLVVAGRSSDVHDAGRLYLGMALVGEILILAGFLVGIVRPQDHSLTAVLLVCGFGAKLGLPPFHIALPVAYRAAPNVCGALLSSVLVNAAVLGALRFLPFGEEGSSPSEAMALVLIGLLMAFGGAIVGITQHNAKQLLGYSTVSQMGILVSAIGIGAGQMGGIAVTAPAAVLFAAHHGLVKAALFLGLGATSLRKDRRLALLLLLSLSLAAAPLTGGAIAKLWVESAASRLPTPWSGALHWVLPLTSAATAVLMLRFIELAMRNPPPRIEPRARAADLLILVLAAVAVPWAVIMLTGISQQLAVLEFGHLWVGIWPLLLAALLYLPRVLRKADGGKGRPPPRSLMGVPLEDVARRPVIVPAWRRRWMEGMTAGAGLVQFALRHVIVTEVKLRSFPRFGILFLGLAAACAIALLRQASP